MNQLGLDGAETPYPVPAARPLSERQRQVVLYMRAHDGPVRPLEVGMLMHAGREQPCMVLLDFRRNRVGCCRHASSDGADALHRLERRGLVVRQGRGAWTLATHTEAWT
jgi:hypothetical protein